MARRIDPRAEPVSIPPADGRDDPVPTDVVRLSGAPVEAKKDANAPGATDVASEPKSSEPTSSSAAAPGGVSIASRVTNLDPRIEKVEESLARGDWSGVAKELGSVGEASRLPPNLGLVCALAHAESSVDAPGANELAIRSMAAIFGVAPESRLALMLAKRLLRKNPVAWRQRPAPPARISLLIVLMTLVVGGAVGWLLSSGIVKIRF